MTPVRLEPAVSRSRVKHSTTEGKMMCNNPNVDLVNVNAYIKFGEILSICFQDIEWKQNYNRMTDGLTDNPNPI